jgi:hypothetical protein
VILTGIDGGETSMVVFDDSGAALMQSTVRVEAPSDPDIFVQRGLERRSYHCAPGCRLVGVTMDGGGGAGVGAAITYGRTGSGAAAQPDDSNKTQSGRSGL